MSSTLLFFALFSICSCQVLLNLRDFNGGNAKNRLNPGPDQTGVYVSAFSDSVDLLSKIFIVFGNNGTQTSLYDLKDLRVSTGEIFHCIIDNSTYLTTSLSNNQMAQLTGLMFISSPRQLVDMNFHVMDASYQLDIRFKKVDLVDYTVLFLNTNFNVNPSTPTIISQWTQYEGSSVYLYSGYPQDKEEPTNTQMFSNPMTINGSDVFFSNVEQFSLTSSAFYMRTFFGGPNFIMYPGYFNIDGSVTTTYTTTGFYAKAIGDADSVKTIRTLRTLGSSGFTGANIIGTLPNGGNITVGEYDGNSHHTFTVQASNFSWNTPFFSWNTPFIGETFRISSSGTQRGEFFVQYFVHQGPLKEVPTTATPTTQSIQTTTKSCGTNILILSLGFVVFLSGF